MNGVHDMGGMHGMGPIEIEQNEPVFHAEWERRIFALRLASAFHRRWNGDMNRHAVERMPPARLRACSGPGFPAHGGDFRNGQEAPVQDQAWSQTRPDAIERRPCRGSPPA